MRLQQSPDEEQSSPRVAGVVHAVKVDWHRKCAGFQPRESNKKMNQVEAEALGRIVGRALALFCFPLFAMLLVAALRYLIIRPRISFVGFGRAVPDSCNHLLFLK